MKNNKGVKCGNGMPSKSFIRFKQLFCNPKLNLESFNGRSVTSCSSAFMAGRIKN